MELAVVNYTVLLLACDLDNYNCLYSCCWFTMCLHSSLLNNSNPMFNSSWYLASCNYMQIWLPGLHHKFRCYLSWNNPGRKIYFCYLGYELCEFWIQAICSPRSCHPSPSCLTLILCLYFKCLNSLSWQGRRRIDIFLLFYSLQNVHGPYNENLLNYWWFLFTINIEIADIKITILHRKKNHIKFKTEHFTLLGRH